MILLTSLSIKVVPKMYFVPMCLSRAFTCNATPDDISRRINRGSWKFRPERWESFSQETDGLAVETTVPQITARAGLTTRSFFRHFADKREVLFAVEEELPAVVERVVADAPASLSPMKLIAYGLETVAATRFEGHFEYLKTHSIIQADESLREREMRKLSVLYRGFRDRGFDELTSMLAAQLAVSVFSVTISRWLDQDGEQPLSKLVHDTLHALGSIIADTTEQPPSA